VPPPTGRGRQRQVREARHNTLAQAERTPSKGRDGWYPWERFPRNRHTGWSGCGATGPSSAARTRGQHRPWRGCRAPSHRRSNGVACGGRKPPFCHHPGSPSSSCRRGDEKYRAGEVNRAALPVFPSPGDDLVRCSGVLCRQSRKAALVRRQGLGELGIIGCGRQERRTQKCARASDAITMETPTTGGKHLGHSMGICACAKILCWRLSVAQVAIYSPPFFDPALDTGGEFVKA
jgi:hypothetical protein